MKFTKKLLVFTIFFKLSLCRDYYVGMFKKNDFLVAQDTIYKERNNYGFTVAKYGRLFNCPITYFRVSDRLGVGRPPSVKVNRGGIQKKYLTLILTSSYNMPIAVNIYVGCENKMSTTPRTTKVQTTTAAKVEETVAEKNTTAGGITNPEEAAGGKTTTVAGDNNVNETAAAGEVTTAGADAGADDATTAAGPGAETPAS